MTTREEGYTIVCAGDFNAHTCKMEEKGDTIYESTDDAGKTITRNNTG